MTFVVVVVVVVALPKHPSTKTQADQIEAIQKRALLEWVTVCVRVNCLGVQPSTHISTVCLIHPLLDGKRVSVFWLSNSKWRWWT